MSLLRQYAPFEFGFTNQRVSRTVPLCRESVILSRWRVYFISVNFLDSGKIGHTFVVANNTCCGHAVFIFIHLFLSLSIFNQEAGTLSPYVRNALDYWAPSQ